MSELFDEVDEELRREQLKKIWEKYSLLIIGAAFLIVAGVGGWRGYEYLETQKAVKASAAFEAASTLADQNKHGAACRAIPVHADLRLFHRADVADQIARRAVPARGAASCGRHA